MRSPRIRFAVRDREKEARYICFTAKSIVKNEFQKAGLLVLPKQIKNTIFFPDLAYSKEFWRSINFTKNVNLIDPFPLTAVKEVVSKLPKLTQKKFDDSEWRQVETKFFELVVNFLDGKKIIKQIGDITVLYTKFGSKGSFFPYRKDGKVNIYATIRDDYPLNNLVKTLLMTFYKIKKKEDAPTGSSKWFLRQDAAEFLVKQTAFKYLVSNHFKHIPIKYYKQSEAYLEKLGFPSEKILLNPEKSTFTLQETNLLQKLITKEGRILSFDQTANTLWGKDADEKYSLEAMAKVIENIRRKIREQGINREVVGTVRKKGYVYLGTFN